MTGRTTVRVAGRELDLSNLERVMYPGDDRGPAVTKAEVIDYYARIAPVMVAHLAGRCITFVRHPDGAHRPGFFEKRCPRHRPTWLRAAIGPGDRDGDIGYCRIDEPAALVWAANRAALEIHVPMAMAHDLDTPRSVVFDLDPGAPAALRECCALALRLRGVLESVGLDAYAKTSGSKGLQVYVPLNTPGSHREAASFALAVGRLLERDDPRRVTTTMAKVERPGKVFIDWRQNARHTTTIGVYSLRARTRPWVSSPVSWGEVERCAEGTRDLRFEPAEALARVMEHGDLFAGVLAVEQRLPTPPGR